MSNLSKGCRVAQIVRSQLEEATKHLRHLENQRISAGGRVSCAGLDEEIDQAAESVVRFQKALELHQAIDGCF